MSITLHCRHGLPAEQCGICRGQYRTRKPVKREPRVNQQLDADVVIVAAGVIAYKEYLQHAAYVCQPNRNFARSPRWMGFYADEEIKPEIPEILHERDVVLFTTDEVARLRAMGTDVELRVADLIETLLRQGAREYRAELKVVLLSPADDKRTLILPHPIKNDLTDYKGSGTAFTQFQRYTQRAELERRPLTTSELVVTGEEP
jgi:hypothetical protein